MGPGRNSTKSVQNDREERQQGTSEERLRLAVPRLSLGHGYSKTPAFSAEWMVNQEKQAVQKLSGAVHVQAGVDVYKVQRLLGHKSPIMTQRYAHHYPESLRDGVEILERYRLASTKSTNLAQTAQTVGPALATNGVSC